MTRHEAALPGSPWRIPASHAGGIEGFADRTSVTAGTPVRLFVSTAARTFRVRAFRMGWYRGRLGRQVWLSGTVTGRQQPGPTAPSARTNTVVAPWRPSMSVPTAGWLPGDYLLRLESGDGHASFVPLTVRAGSAAGRVVLVSPVTTWQAYNTWGCCDLYQGGDGSFDSRSRAVSFDRPYALENGAGNFIWGELPVVAEAERLGLPLDYVTDVDLDADPHLLDGARAVVSMGHDEYWSPAMRSTVTAARDAGTNLAFLGANAVYRRIRFASTPIGPRRLEINYKIPQEDPLLGVDNAAVTADWRAWPHPDPESSLLGAEYGCFLQGQDNAPGVVADPQSWLLRGTGVRAGQKLPGLIGPETNAVQPGYPMPRPLEVLLHSPVDCPADGPAAADATYYVARSGAGVFDAGTISWAHMLRDGAVDPADAVTQRVVRTVTDRLLQAFVVGPAGRAHPARDNLRALGLP